MSVLDKKTDLDDEVTRPNHYGGPNAPFEPIKVIHDVGLGPGFYFGSALKYIQRAPHKDSRRSDLKKAMWYLTTGVELGYTIDQVGEMDPEDVVAAWQLDESLGEIAERILRGDVSYAALAMKQYVEADAPPQPDAAPMPFAKG